MASNPKRRRTTTLSISLTRELSEAVAARVRSGLYTSASELVREALRLLLEVEEARRLRLADRVAETPGSWTGSKFANTSKLVDLGLLLREGKLIGAAPGLTEAEVRERLERLEEEQETGPGLRISPERLEKLKLRE